MEKYYTPKISEFYHGFLYEAKERFMDGTVKTKEDFENAEWMPQTCDLNQTYIYRALNGFNFENGFCGIRVKYLDREDIESLGWQHIHTDFFRKGQYYVKYNSKMAEIADDITHQLIAISPVKNISEFKTLLQNLNIK